MRQKKRMVCFMLSFVFLFSFIVPCDAHPRQPHHYKDIESVLFETGFSKNKKSNSNCKISIKDSIKAIEFASYLTIDQFQGNGQKQLDKLKELGMGGLPRKLTEIDYQYNFEGEKKVNANTHRRYTHEGWERDYSVKGKKQQEFWKKRKKVLLGTVNSVFDFSDITMFGYDEKCNSMAGIIYYVHILGDHIEADNYKKISLLTELAGRKHANEDDKDYDMITCLKKYVEILFEDQEETEKYKNLMKGLKKIEKGAGKLVKSTGGVNTDEEFKKYHEYAEELLKLLQDNMPYLLKKEAFFQMVFYPELL